jgi:hypothetical protein
MTIDDLAGRVSDAGEAEFNQRLHTVRRGVYGAFILSHEEAGSSLWVHINGNVAYLHYFPDAQGRHPGYQAAGMTPEGCDEPVWFLQVNGTQADGFEMPASALVAVEVSYDAAREFFLSPGLPHSVSWFEL